MKNNNSVKYHIYTDQLLFPWKRFFFKPPKYQLYNTKEKKKDV